MTRFDVGLGIRLSHEEDRRLDELARRTGRTKGAVLRALIRLASARDETNLELIRNELRKAEDAYVQF